MSSAGKTYNNNDPKCWFPHQRNLILLVKKYPIAYLGSPKKMSNLEKTKLDSVWEEIASILGQPSKKCKQVWTMIKLKYAKIMILINTGKITKEAAISHPETNRFFDGLLSFLDPYILCDISDENIPFIIHKSINDLYGLKTTHLKETLKEDNPHFVTHAQVHSLLTERKLKGDVVESTQIEHLQAVVDIAIQRKLWELMKNSSSNSRYDMVNINDEETVNVPMTANKNTQTVGKTSATLNPSDNILNKDKENRIKSIKLGLESELIIEDDNIKIEKVVDINAVEEDNINSQNEDCENILDADITMEENMALEMNIKKTVDENTLMGLNEHAIITVNNTDDRMNNEAPISDEYMRHFFTELGEIMSLEMPVHRQKILKSRINDLLKSNLLKEKEGRRFSYNICSRQEIRQGEEIIDHTNNSSKTY